MASIAVNVDLDELMESLAVRGDYDKLIQSIVKIDLAVADVGFTEEVIKRLTRSIRDDMTADEFSTLLAELGGVAA